MNWIAYQMVSNSWYMKYNKLIHIFKWKSHYRAGSFQYILRVSSKELFNSSKLCQLWRQANAKLGMKKLRCSCCLIEYSIVNDFFTWKSLTFMLLVANFTNTKPHKKWLKPWHTDTQLRIISVRYPMNTNMIGFRRFSKIFESLYLGQK